MIAMDPAHEGARGRDREPRVGADLRRRLDLGGQRVDSGLAAAVVAPAPERAIESDRARLRGSGRDRTPALDHAAVVDDRIVEPEQLSTTREDREQRT